jgi:1-deoxy-D-xylulose-5-phosphate synthase
LSIGPIGNNVVQAITELSDKPQESQLPPHSLSIAHYDMRFLKPLDESLLHEVGQRFQRIVTVENGVKKGGFGSAVLEWMNDHGYKPQIIRLGLPDNFVEHGKVSELQQIVGLDTESIKCAINSLISSKQ